MWFVLGLEEGEKEAKDEEKRGYHCVLLAVGTAHIYRVLTGMKWSHATMKQRGRVRVSVNRERPK